MTRTLATSTALLLALLASTTLTACPANCGSCGTKDKQPFCFVCQGGFKWDDGKCDEQLTQVQNCEFHSAAGCLGCKQTFFMNMNTQLCLQPPAANNIANCLVGLINEDPQTKVKTYQCQVCKGFYPNEKQTACDVAIKPADNCQNGTVDDYYKPSCMTCKSGYISYNGKCTRSPQDNCMYANTKGQCVQCRDGYFMKFSGVCAKANAAQEKVEAADI